MPIIYVYACDVCGKETRGKERKGWHIQKRRWHNIRDEHQIIVFCPEHANKAEADGDKIGIKIFDTIFPIAPA